jgi:UDP-GlcNAc:undecaprenyl-phosphate GlcNAc-1-phosphate transferase
MSLSLFVFVAVAGASAAVVALILRLAHSKAWYDRVDERKAHKGDVPRLGGLGFVPVFIVASSVLMFSMGQEGQFAAFLPVVAGAFAMSFFGVWDDFRPLRPALKLLIQIGAALCVVISGYHLQRLAFFDGNVLQRLPLLGSCLTVLWIVGMSNAVNLIDGVDSLAGGVSLIAAATFAYIFYRYSGMHLSVMVCVALAGSVAGFLVFNAPFPRAKIFMGDGGSQFLGFILAVLPLLKGSTAGIQNLGTALPLLHIAAILSIPILDTISAVWRRTREKRPVSSPDKEHTHHKLMNLGLSHRQIVAVMLGLQLAVSFLTVLSFEANRESSGLMSMLALGAAYFIVIVFFSALHFMNRKRTKTASPQNPNQGKT